MKIILLMLFVIAIFGFTEIVFADTSLNIGHIEWFTQNFHNSKIPVHKIQVTDPDMNRNPDELDKFTVNVWSDSDPAGMSVLVYETEKNSGIFDTLVISFPDESSDSSFRIDDPSFA